MAVASGSIVKNFDVIKNISLSDIPSFVNSLTDTLFVQRAEE